MAAKKGDWQFPSDPKPGPLSDDQRVQQQWAQIDSQDGILDDISVAIGGLKGHATNMNGELDAQGKIIDEMNGDIDAAQDGLVAETAHTMRIRKQSGLCRYYLCILLLFGILMALLVLG